MNPVIVHRNFIPVVLLARPDLLEGHRLLVHAERLPEGHVGDLGTLEGVVARCADL